MEDGFPDDERGDQGLAGLGSPHFAHQNGERIERYSRKVFVGGLPPDIDEGIRISRLKVGPFFPLWHKLTMSMGSVQNKKEAHPKSIKPA